MLTLLRGRWNGRVVWNCLVMVCFFSNNIAGVFDRTNKNYNFLLILADEIAHKFVAQYLVWFKWKSKYDQVSIILEWFKYSNVSMRGGNTWAHQKRSLQKSGQKQSTFSELYNDETCWNESVQSFQNVEKYPIPWFSWQCSVCGTSCGTAVKGESGESRSSRVLGSLKWSEICNCRVDSEYSIWWWGWHLRHHFFSWWSFFPCCHRCNKVILGHCLFESQIFLFGFV